MAEGRRGVPLFDEGLCRLDLERRDSGRVEAKPFGGLDTVVEILQRRQVRIGAQEYLGEVFQRLKLPCAVLCQRAVATASSRSRINAAVVLSTIRP
ncbi:MAG: hypothetical protein AAB011_10860 [Candidatus Eisenbacteria bacterium]